MMTNDWQEVPLGNLLKRIKNAVLIDDFEKYQRLTIRTNNKGISVRDELEGHRIGTKKQFIVHQGQFLLSKIDAMNGAFGIVPEDVQKGIVTSNFWAYDVDEERLFSKYFNYLTHTKAFQDFCVQSSSGTTHRKYLQEDLFLGKKIYLPSIEEQHHTVVYIEELKIKINSIKRLKSEINVDLDRMLFSAYNKIASASRQKPLEEVAPLTRRATIVDSNSSYPQVAVRSFGRGTFHKPNLDGDEITWQKPFLVKANDILISNIKAWEGAIAVANENDDGRFGSHRYLTCVPLPNVATSRFVCFYLLTEEGLGKIGEASPGTADRNRTLNAKALMKIPVPVPPIEKQLWFDNLYAEVASLRELQAQTQEELDALLPSVLDKAFKGDLC